MHVNLDGHPFALSDTDLIGEGGEARVYALPHSAAGVACVVKVFHDGAPAHLVALREQKLRAFPTDLPAAIVAPQTLALNDRGDVVGYRMRRVAAAIDIARLGKPQVRAVVDANRVLVIFRQMIEALRELHARAVIVGDLNDGNVVIADDGAGLPFFIDADSLQLGALPCPVAHERFLDPRLFGVNLVDKPCFSADSDHYALRVLLFQSLCCVHPYGGTHPTLPTMLRRAEARQSALRPDVVLPRVALRADALPDALRADLSRCFDDDARAPLDPRLLDVAFIRCACGLEHAQRSCPACRVTVVVPAVFVHSGVSFERVTRAGTILAAESTGAALRFLVDDGAQLVREDGDVVLVGRHAGLGFGFAGRRTWIASSASDQHGELVCVEGGCVVDRTSTGTALGAPSWAASPSGLFRLHGDTIVHHDSGTVVGKALIGRTWLFPVDDGCVAVWRAGKIMRLLWCRPSHGPVDHALPGLSGRIVDTHVVSDGDRALLCMAVDDGGVRLHRLTLLSRSQGVLAHLQGRPDELPVLGNLRGKLLSGDKLLSTSTAGLLLLDAASSTNGTAFPERARFPGTSALCVEHGVDDSVDLLRGSGGDLFVVSDAAIHLLRRRAATSAPPNRSTP